MDAGEAAARKVWEARRLVQDALDPAKLRPDASGQSIGPVQAAARAVPSFVDKLADLYEVKGWDATAFRRAFLEGAQRGWKGNMQVRSTPDEVVATSTGCPLRDEVAKDPRLCSMCQAFQRLVAIATIPDHVRAVRFDNLVTRGDDACVARYELKK